MKKLANKIFHAVWPYVWIWGSLMVGLTVYGSCMLIKPWYGYTALLRPPEFPVAVDKTGKSASLSSTLFGVGNAPTMAQDAQSFVEFSYIKRSFRGLNVTAMVKTAQSSKDSPYLEVVIYARSLERAAEYLKEVVDHLRQVYAPRIQDAKSDVLSQIAVLDDKIARESDLLRQTEQAGRRLGYSPQLLETSMQLDRDLLTMRLTRGQLMGSISDQKLYNFQIVEARPIDLVKPVSPRRGLLTAVSVTLTASLLFFFGIGRRPHAPAPVAHDLTMAEKRRA